MKKLLSLAIVGLAGGAMALAGTVQPTAVRAESDVASEAVDFFGDHNYFTGAGGVWGNNALTDETESTLEFKRLTSIAGGGDNCWFGMDGKDVMHAGKYIFRAKMRLDANYKGDNVGFGMWSTTQDARINERVFYDQLKKGEWADVEVRFDLAEADIFGVDSIHFWLVNGGSDTYIDIMNMEFRSISDAELGENLIKDVGFENIDLTAGDKIGWSDRHSGKIGCADSQVLWTKEGEGDSYNQFLRLNYNNETDVQFADFCSFLNDFDGAWPAGIPQGNYLIKMDIRKNAAFGETDNVGLALYSRNEPRIERSITDQVNKATAGEWTTVSLRYPDDIGELTQTYCDGVDTLQFWANTNSRIGAALDIDNVEIRKVSPAIDERPEFKDGVYSYAWVEANNEDVAIEVADLHGHESFTITDANGYELAVDEDYTYADSVITIKKEFVSDYSDGINTFTIATEGGSRDFTIEVTHVQEDLPNQANYDLEETVFGGDFMDLDVGYRMSEDQTENAWGSVSLDDPGVIVAEEDGSHALQLKPAVGSTKSYSSAFVIYHPQKIVADTIVTLSFDYKYTGGTNTDDGVDLCWVGSANKSFHLIKLNGAENAQTIEPEAKYRSWDVHYEDAANGYRRATVSLRIDAATTLSTNSLRFLMKHNGSLEQELRITNVSLKRWVMKLGTLTETAGTYTKGTEAGHTINATLTESGSLDSVACDSVVTYLEDEDFTTVEGAEGALAITLKQAYLDKLSEGEHTIYVILTDGEGQYSELEYKLTVAKAGSEEPTKPEEPEKKGCKGSIIATSGLISIVSIAGAALLASKGRKEDK